MPRHLLRVCKGFDAGGGKERSVQRRVLGPGARHRQLRRTADLWLAGWLAGPLAGWLVLAGFVQQGVRLLWGLLASLGACVCAHCWSVA